MHPQAEASPIAISPPGALYTANFIPKYIDKSAASFALLSDGTVRVYDGSGQAVMQLPASQIQVKSYAKALYNAIKVSLQGTDYIFASNFNAPIGGVGGAAGMIAGEQTIRSANDFFKLIEQQSANPAAVQSPQPQMAAAAAAALQAQAPEAYSQFPQAQSYAASPAQPPVDTVGQEIRAKLAKRARSYLISGGIIFGLSILATVVSFLISKNGAFYVFWYGLLIGGILLVRGILSQSKLR